MRASVRSDALHGSPRDYRKTSFWLESTSDDLTPRAQFKNSLTVDVAILGGGFSGLWTAYYLLRDNPGLEVAILERDIVGFGASGRNGGWCSTRFPVDPVPLVKRIGVDAARHTVLALQEAVLEVGRVAAAENIDAHYRNTGILSVARGAAQVSAIQSAYAAYDRLGLGAHNRLLSAAEAKERLNATRLTGALYSNLGATIHPGNLVRGLARGVERLGGVIFEGSAVTGFSGGSTPALTTELGCLKARRAIVLAGEAYLSQMPLLSRALLPMSSMIVVTEPLSESQWSVIGWQGGESVASQSHTKNYLTRTADGRILYGSRGAPYLFGSAIDDSALNNEQVYASMRSTLREWFPALEHTGFTHAWGGFLGVPRDWMPTTYFDPACKIARLYGYTGRGVATTNLAGRLVSGLIAGRESGLESLPVCRAHAPSWEREPLRWAAVRYVQSALARIDRAEESGKRPPLDAAIAKYLGGQ